MALSSLASSMGQGRDEAGGRGGAGEKRIQSLSSLARELESFLALPEFPILNAPKYDGGDERLGAGGGDGLAMGCADDVGGWENRWWVGGWAGGSAAGGLVLVMATRGRE